MYLLTTKAAGSHSANVKESLTLAVNIIQRVYAQTNVSINIHNQTHEQVNLTLIERH